MNENFDWINKKIKQIYKKEPCWLLKRRFVMHDVLGN